MTYVDAAQRHLRLFENGELLARDTTVQNLGAVMACCAIIIDAMAHDSAIDNRRPSKPACDALHGRGEQMVAHLKAANEARKAKEQPKQPRQWILLQLPTLVPNLVGLCGIELLFADGRSEKRKLNPAYKDFGIDWAGVTAWRPHHD